jgi:hypothetical protein
MANPIDAAFDVLIKALPEQQMGYMNPKEQYGSLNRTSTGTKGWSRTMHPAIQGLINRRQPIHQSKWDWDRPKLFAESDEIAVRTPNLHDFSSSGGDDEAEIQNLPGHPAEWRNPPIEDGERVRRGMDDDDPTPSYKERVKQIALDRKESGFDDYGSPV